MSIQDLFAEFSDELRIEMQLRFAARQGLAVGDVAEMPTFRALIDAMVSATGKAPRDAERSLLHGLFTGFVGHDNADLLLSEWYAPAAGPGGEA